MTTDLPQWAQEALAHYERDSQMIAAAKFAAQQARKDWDRMMERFRIQERSQRRWWR